MGGEIDLVDLVDLGVGVGVGPLGVLESLAPVVDAASLVGDLDGRRLDVVEFGNVVVALDMMVESDVPVRLLLLPSGTTTLAEVVRWATRVAERQMAAFTAIARADMMVSGRTDTRTRPVKATMVAQ